MVERLEGSGREEEGLATFEVKRRVFWCIQETGTLELVVVCDVGWRMGMVGDRSLWSCRSWRAAQGARSKGGVSAVACAPLHGLGAASSLLRTVLVCCCFMLITCF